VFSGAPRPSGPRGQVVDGRDGCPTQHADHLPALDRRQNTSRVGKVLLPGKQDVEDNVGVDENLQPCFLRRCDR
jgi:hypothetical protein